MLPRFGIRFKSHKLPPIGNGEHDCFKKSWNSPSSTDIWPFLHCVWAAANRPSDFGCLLELMLVFFSNIFFSNASYFRSFSSHFVAFIPQVVFPPSLGEFCPISLIRFLYYKLVPFKKILCTFLLYICRLL